MSVDTLASDVHTVSCSGRSYRMHLPWAATDSIQHHLATSGSPYESELVLDVLQRCSPGDLVVDVGANIGNHAVAWGVNGLDVLAFEPHPELASALQSSVETNHLEDHVIVFEKALSDHDGSSHLVGMTEQNMGTGHLDEALTSGLAVEVGILRDPARPVAVIKVDTEGTEATVLRGARPVLERHHPLLYVECLDQQSFDEVWQVLQPLGYHYEQTFNASPTHRFAWSDVESPADETVLMLLRRYYEAHGSWTRVRQQLMEANAKYRSATTSFAALQERLREEREQHESTVNKLREQVPATAREVVDAHQTVADMLGVVTALESRLLEQKRNGEEWAKEHETVTARLAISQTDVARLARRVGELETETSVLNQLLEERTQEMEAHSSRMEEERAAWAVEAKDWQAQVNGLCSAVQEQRDAAKRTESEHERVLQSLFDELTQKSLTLSLSREREDARQVLKALTEARRENFGLAGRASANSGMRRVRVDDLAYLREWITQQQERENSLVSHCEELQAALETTPQEREIDAAQRGELQGRAERFRREAQGLHEMRREDQRELKALRAEVARLSEHGQRLEAQKRQLRYEMTQLRKSRTMLVGREFGRTKGPVSILTLPWRIYTVGRKPSAPAPKEIEK